MARTDSDTWDLASSVGATATMVAAMRAVASRVDQAVIDDPFAAPLVAAVGVDFFARLADGELTPEQLDAGDAPLGIRRFADAMAARTRFFDDFFAAATAAGIRQAVILASGLDARGYRLSWPADMVVFEIDQQDVIDFKVATLTGMGAEPTADVRAVAVDLRADWPAALAGAGFDADAPTAWIAEGLLGYLPPEAQDRLLDQVTALSPAGSRLAVEGVPAQHAATDEQNRARMAESAERWAKHGYAIDFTELVFVGDRAEVADYLLGHGWTTSAATSRELLATYGLPPLDAGEGLADICYYTATR